MALIKNKDAEGLARRGFEDLGDLRKQAQELIDEARREAARILDEARAEARTLIDEASPRGEAEGREKGLAEGHVEGTQVGREEAVGEYRQRLDELVASWTTALDTLESGRRDMLLAAREDVIEFALAMGRRITLRTIEGDPSIVSDQVAATLELVAEPTKVTLTVHPDDEKLIKSVLPDLATRLNGSDHVELRTDEQITRGGCVLTTGMGHIDATIERQIERIADALLGRKTS